MDMMMRDVFLFVILFTGILCDFVFIFLLLKIFFELAKKV